MSSADSKLIPSALQPATFVAFLQLATVASVLTAYWLFPVAMQRINELLATLNGARGPGAGTLSLLFLLYWLFGVVWTSPYWLAPVLCFLLPLLCVYPLLRRDPVGVLATLLLFQPAAPAKGRMVNGRHASALFLVSLIWPALFYGLTLIIGKGPWLAFSGWWLWLCMSFYLFVLVLLTLVTVEWLTEMAARRAATLAP